MKRSLFLSISFILCVRQTPRIGLLSYYIDDYKKKSGVSGFCSFATFGPRKTSTV